MSPARGFRVFSAAWILLSVSLSTEASEIGSTPCFEDEVMRHVRDQFAIYGPRSSQYEYFGFIYRKDGRVDSAVTHDFACRGQMECVVNTVFALRRIPKGAKVLGEWHTHPHFHEADVLSMEDVRGAQANRHVRCYTAVLQQLTMATSTGGISTRRPWRPRWRSRMRLGNYREPDEPADPGLASNSGPVRAAINGVARFSALKVADSLVSRFS